MARSDGHLRGQSIESYKSERNWQRFMFGVSAGLGSLATWGTIKPPLDLVEKTDTGPVYEVAELLGDRGMFLAGAVVSFGIAKRAYSKTRTLTKKIRVRKRNLVTDPAHHSPPPGPLESRLR